MVAENNCLLNCEDVYFKIKYLKSIFVIILSMLCFLKYVCSDLNLLAFRLAYLELCSCAFPRLHAVNPLIDIKL